MSHCNTLFAIQASDKQIWFHHLLVQKVEYLALSRLNCCLYQFKSYLSVFIHVDMSWGWKLHLVDQVVEVDVHH